MLNSEKKKILLAVLSAVTIAALSGCGSSESSQASETTAAAATEASTQAQTSAQIDPAQLHSYTDGADEFAGAWKITEGSGSQFDTFVYIFSGDGEADLVMGNTGYISNYTLSSSDKSFVCQLMYGINGTYTYELSNAGTIVLTDSDTEETTTLEKLDSFSPLPSVGSDVQTDESILGAWMSDSGEYYYFGSDGIMYQNQYTMIFTYYSYSASDGTISAVSDMGTGEQTTDLSYSVDGDVLKLDGYEYTRIDLSQLV